MSSWESIYRRIAACSITGKLKDDLPPSERAVIDQRDSAFKEAHQRANQELVRRGASRQERSFKKRLDQVVALGKVSQDEQHLIVANQVRNVILHDDEHSLEYRHLTRGYLLELVEMLEKFCCGTTTRMKTSEDSTAPLDGSPNLIAKKARTWTTTDAFTPELEASVLRIAQELASDPGPTEGSAVQERPPTHDEVVGRLQRAHRLAHIRTEIATRLASIDPLFRQVDTHREYLLAKAPDCVADCDAVREALRQVEDFLTLEAAPEAEAALIRLTTTVRRLAPVTVTKDRLESIIQHKERELAEEQRRHEIEEERKARGAEHASADAKTREERRVRALLSACQGRFALLEHTLSTGVPPTRPDTPPPSIRATPRHQATKESSATTLRLSYLLKYFHEPVTKLRAELQDLSASIHGVASLVPSATRVDSLDAAITTVERRLWKFVSVLELYVSDDLQRQSALKREQAAARMKELETRCQELVRFTLDFRTKTDIFFVDARGTHLRETISIHSNAAKWLKELDEFDAEVGRISRHVESATSALSQGALPEIERLVSNAELFIGAAEPKQTQCERSLPRLVAELHRLVTQEYINEALRRRAEGSSPLAFLRSLTPGLDQDLSTAEQLVTAVAGWHARYRALQDGWRTRPWFRRVSDSTRAHREESAHIMAFWRAATSELRTCHERYAAAHAWAASVAERRLTPEVPSLAVQNAVYVICERALSEDGCPDTP